MDTEKYDVFQKFDDYRYERNLKPGYVGADYYWLVDEEQNLFMGEICIRHRLTDALLQYGGHIGYGIRFSEWNKGYGTLMLQLALEKAKDRGIEKVLITCDDDNVGSTRVVISSNSHGKNHSQMRSFPVTYRNMFVTLCDRKVCPAG